MKTTKHDNVIFASHYDVKEVKSKIYSYFNFNLIPLHILIWVIYIGYGLPMSYLIRNTEERAAFDWRTSIISYLIVVAVFYFFVYVVFPVFKYKKITSYVHGGFLIFLGFLVHTSVRAYFGAGLPGRSNTGIDFLNFFQPPMLYRSIYLYMDAFLIALLFWFAIASRKRAFEIIRIEQEKKSIQTEQFKMQQEKLMMENAFLKAQINPHFLFNTLSYFYTKVYKLSPEVASGIAELSDIMRYSIDSEEDERGFGLLENEINQLKNLIKINNLRFNHRLNIQFKVIGEVGRKKIMPHLMITILENIFKHGDLQVAGFVTQIQIVILESEISFNSINKKKKNTFKDKSTGIGIKNINNRLKALYRDDYFFEIKEVSDTYETILKVPIIH